jgi:hypothetical protein
MWNGDMLARKRFVMFSWELEKEKAGEKEI